jgi:Arc/MetJ-type ribon-helix-helix transcriptional regulator
MKLSVSLPDEDVAVLDEFARTTGLSSRSAALHHAVRMLRLPELEQDYEAAWNEWEASADHAAWSVTVADGIADVAR